MIFLLSFCGCTKNEQNFLSYQDKNFEAKIDFEIKEKSYSAKLEKQNTDTYKISFISPETLKNVYIEKKGDELSYSIWNVHIPIQEKTNVCAKIINLFNLSDSELTSAKTKLHNGLKINIADFSTEYGKVTLYISSEKNLPVRIESNIDGVGLNLNISEFKFTDSNN